jgi:microcystin-dependent protein
MFDTRDLILLILTIIIIYLLYETINKEKFDTTTDAIKAQVVSQYQEDIDYMKKLTLISSQILSNNDNLTLPPNNTIPNSLTVNGNLIGNSVSLSGNTVFTGKDTNTMELYPRGIVIAWYNDNPPKGWAICDGNYYKLDNNFNANKCEPTDVGAILTPDLRSKFIIGANGTNENETFTENNQNLTTRPYKSVGGEENHTLNVYELPSHNHFVFYSGISNGSYRIWKNPSQGYVGAPNNGGKIVDSNTSAVSGVYDEDSSSSDYMILSGGSFKFLGENLYRYANVGLTSNTGNNDSHNNIPPYISLYYYMKL